MCGYNIIVLILHTFVPGSSPRVRVQHSLLLRNKINRGIIPACAGTTQGIQGKDGATGDHPRVCGYNLKGLIPMNLQLGSSPRVRVQLYLRTTMETKTGIIPACAGTTFEIYTIRRNHRDHPRVCGYNIIILHYTTPLAGSSPRVRVQLMLSIFRF